MSGTHFSGLVYSGGFPPIAGGVPFVRNAYRFVNGVNGNDTYDGLSTGGAKRTAGDAIADLRTGDCIFLANLDSNNGYDESLTIGRTDSNGDPLSNIVIVGGGGRGAAFVSPSSSNPIALTVHADDVTLINLGIAGSGTGSALVCTGRRFRAIGCKIEGGTNTVVIGPGTAAQVSAHTRGNGSDAWFDDCEFAWGVKAVCLQCTDYGSVTQHFYRNCHFHNNSTSSFDEITGSGGAAAVSYRNIVIQDCVFDNMEDGTVPNKIVLNDDNANTGMVTGCRFSSAINSGKNLVSTKMLWIGNYHTGGIATAQPS